MSQLRKYIDANSVTVFVNPDEIVLVTVNREGLGQPWSADFLLRNGLRFVLWDDSSDRLMERIVGGDR